MGFVSTAPPELLHLNSYVFLFLAVLDIAHHNRLVLLHNLGDELLHHQHRGQQRSQALQVLQPKGHVEQSAVRVHELECKHLPI